MFIYLCRRKLYLDFIPVLINFEYQNKGGKVCIMSLPERFCCFFFQTFHEHPLVLDYCSHAKNISSNDTLSLNGSLPLIVNSTNTGYSFGNLTNHEETSDHHIYSGHKDEVKNMPNTALMSTILTLGTFLLAYFLRIFRNSKFLGRRVSP